MEKIEEALREALRENEYLRREKTRYAKSVEGYKELTKICMAVILFLGEKTKEDAEKIVRDKNFKKRTEEIIKLL